MKVLKSKRNGNTINLEIEASHEELESKFDGAFRKVSKKASLPGFRKGKIPRKIFEKNFGKEVIIQEAIYDVINDTYKSAIEELKLKVVDYPKNVDVDEYKENKAVKFRCDVDVEPELKLKKYKGLKISFDEKKADEDTLKKEMDILIGMHATYESVDGEAKDGDIVRFNGQAKIGDDVFETWSRDNQATRIGAHNYGEAFDDIIVGLQKGDKKDFSITYDDDFKNQDVKGKTVKFDIEVTEIRQRTLPELNDE
ncbi:MAG: trigger factor, partial [Candidatus Margulisiibacteriota bacterium]